MAKLPLTQVDQRLAFDGLGPMIDVRLRVDGVDDIGTLLQRVSYESLLGDSIDLKFTSRLPASHRYTRVPLTDSRNPGGNTWTHGSEVARPRPRRVRADIAATGVDVPVDERKLHLEVTVRGAGPNTKLHSTGTTATI